MFKLLLSLAMVAGLSVAVQAQWLAQNDFPGGGRLGLLSFQVGNNAYVLGGTLETNTGYIAYDDFWKYDPSTDAWEALPDYPGGNTFGGFCFVINDTAYVGMGGNENGLLSKEMWAWHPATGWRQRANFPATARFYPFAFSAQEKGFIGAGFSSTYRDDFWEYDPTTNQWSNKTDYPGGGRVGCPSFSLGGKGYVGMGDDGNSFFNDFYQYDASSDTWTSLASFSGETRSFAACNSINDQGYMIGGESFLGGFDFTDEGWQYDPNSDSWTALPSFIGAGRRYAALFILEGDFYHGLGQTGASDDDVTLDWWKLEATSTAVNDLTLPSNSWQAYPNPFQNSLQLTSTHSDEAEIEVYTSCMERVYKGSSKQLNTRDWAAQPYIILIQSEGQTQALKIIKAE